MPGGGVGLLLGTKDDDECGFNILNYEKLLLC